MKRNQLFSLLSLLSLAVLVGACSQENPRPRRIFYLNSYHAGYNNSDDVMQGIKKTLDGKNIELRVFFMDAKQNPSETHLLKKGSQAVGLIRDFNPDLIIASDDDALQYVVAPHYSQGPVPVVFCGANWTVEPYDFSRTFVTGMVEVQPLRESLETIREYYPELRKLVVLSENTTSEQKNRACLDTLYRSMGFIPEFALVNDFGEWKERFAWANREADLIYMPNHGGIRGWDEAEAKAFVAEFIQKPVITTSDYMMPYAVFGRTKVAVEQGVWAAETALDILNGKSPASIPLAQNAQTKAWINFTLAKKVDFVPGISLLREAEAVE